MDFEIVLANMDNFVDIIKKLTQKPSCQHLLSELKTLTEIKLKFEQSEIRNRSEVEARIQHMNMFQTQVEKTLQKIESVMAIEAANLN